jgi:TP901 family phage tail tape measure protein
MATQVASLFATLGLDSKDFTAGLKEAVSAVDTMSGNFGRAGAALTAAFTLPLVGGLAASLDEFRKWEYNMQKVLALGGDEISGSMNRLKQASLDMAGSFSATEIAAGMAEITAAGYSAEGGLKVLTSAMNLAKIEGINMKDASLNLSNVLKIYGASAEAAGPMTDMLAKASAMSAISVTDLTVAMKYAGPAMALAGIGARETAAAITFLGDAGIRGSSAGTSLRAMLSFLEKPSNQAAAALKSLGIQTKDATGNLLPFIKVIDNLQPLLQNVDAGFRVFGKQFSAAAVVIAQGGDSLKRATKELSDAAGESEKMAKIMENSWQGSLNKMNAEFKNLGIIIGKELAPLARVLGDFALEAIKFAQRIVTAFSELPVSAQIAFGGLAAAVALAGPSLLGLAAILKTGMFVTETINSFVMLGKGATKMSLELAGSEAVAARVGQALSGLSNVASSLLSPLQGIAKSAIGLIESAVQGLGKILLSSGETIKRLPDMVTGAVLNAGQGMATALSSAKNFLVSKAGEIATAVSSAMSKISLSGITQSFSKLDTGTITRSFADLASNAAAAFSSKFGSAVEMVKSKINDISSAMSKVNISTIWANLTSIVATSANSMRLFALETWNAVRANLALAGSNILKFFTDLGTTTRGLTFSTALSSLAKGLGSLTGLVTGGLGTALSAIGGALATITAPAWVATAAVTALVAAIGYFVATRWDQIVSVVKGVWLDISNAITWVGNKIASFINWIFGPGTIEPTNNWLGKIGGMVMSAFKTIKGFIDVIGTAIISSIAFVAEQLGMANTAKALRDWASGTKEIDAAMQKLKNSTQETAKAIPLTAFDKLSASAKDASLSVAKLSDEVALNGATLDNSRSKVAQAEMQLSRLREAQESLNKQYASGLIKTDVYKELSQGISQGITSAVTFIAKFKEIKETGEGSFESVSKASKKLAKEMETNFAAGLLKIRDLADSIPASVEDMNRKFKNPTEVLTYFDKIEEGMRDSIDKNKNMTDSHRQEIIRQTRETQDHLVDMARKAGTATADVSIKGRDAITALTDAMETAKRVGINWVEDTFKKGEKGLDVFTAKLRQFQKDWEETKKNADKEGREIDPKKSEDARIEETYLKLEAKLKMTRQAIRQTFSESGNVKELDAAIKGLGASLDITDEVEAANKSLDVFGAVAEITGQRLDKSFSKGKDKLGAASAIKELGVDIEALQTYAKNAGIQIGEIFTGKVAEGADSFSVALDQSNKQLSAMEKLFAAGRVSAEGLFAMRVENNIAKWQAESGVSLKQFELDLKNAGMNFADFKRQLIEGMPRDFLAELRVSEKLLGDLLKLSGGVETVGTAAARTKVLMSQWQVQTGIDFNIMAASAQRFGIDVKDALDVAQESQKFQQDTANTVTFLQVLADKGMLTFTGFVNATSKLWEGFRVQAEKEFGRVTLASDGAAKVFSATWDLAVTTFGASFTKAATEFNSKMLTAGREFGASLLTFDSGRILDAAKNLGKTFVNGMKEMVVKPFKDMFTTLMDGLSEKVSEFVTQKVLGLMFKGFDSVIGQMPVLGNSLGSAMNQASQQLKNVQGMATTATSAVNNTTSAVNKTTAALNQTANASKTAADGFTNTANAANSASKSVMSSLQSFVSFAGSIGSIVSGIMSVISYFQGKRMEKDIARIEESTRWSKGLLIEIKDILKGQGMQDRIFDYLNQLNDTVNGRIFELQEILRERLTIIHGQLRLMTTAILNGRVVEMEETDPEGTPNTPLTPERPSGNLVSLDSQFNDAIIGTEEELRNLTGTATTTGTALSEAASRTTDWTNAFTDTAVAATGTTEAFDKLKATLPQWAQSFDSFTGKTTKELYAHVSQFGSSLKFSSTLVENGTKRIVTDLSTGVRFLVNVSNDMIEQVGYMGAEAKDAAGTLTDLTNATNGSGSAMSGLTSNTNSLANAANTTSNAFSDVTTSANATSAAIQQVGNQLAIVAPKFTATTQPEREEPRTPNRIAIDTNLPGGVNGIITTFLSDTVSTALSQIEQREENMRNETQAYAGRISSSLNQVNTATEQAQESYRQAAQQLALTAQAQWNKMREAGEIRNTPPVERASNQTDAYLKTLVPDFRPSQFLTNPASLFGNVVNEATQAGEAPIPEMIYPVLPDLPAFPTAPEAPLLPPMENVALKAAPNLNGLTININGVTDPRTAGDATINALRQHGVDV